MTKPLATPSTGRQTTAVEFEVTGSLDGVSVVPPSLVASAPAGDPQQLHRFTVNNLGLIDIDFLVESEGPERRGARGNRLITWLYIRAPQGGLPPNADIAVVDAIDESVTPVVLEQVASLASIVTPFTYYNRDGIYIPQGAMLRLRGLTASSMFPIKVRYHYCSVDCSKAAATIAALNGNGGGNGNEAIGVWTEVFGSNILQGAGENPHYLWPGSGQLAAPEDLVGMYMPQDSIIRAIIVAQQQPNTVFSATVTYGILVNGVLSASVPVASNDGSAQLLDGLAIAVSAGDQVAVQALRSEDHPTIGDVIATVLFEAA